MSYRPVTPMDDLRLHRKLASLPAPETPGPIPAAFLDSVLRFADSYGSLTSREVALVPPGGGKLVFGEHVGHWVEAVHELAQLVAFKDAWHTGDLKALQSHVRWRRRPQASVSVGWEENWRSPKRPRSVEVACEGERGPDRAAFERWLAARPGPESRVYRYSDDDGREHTGDVETRLREPMRTFLYREVNRRLRGHASPEVLPFKNDLLIVPDCLLSALYVLFALELSDKLPIRQCPNCDQFFPPKTARQVYCSDDCRVTHWQKWSPKSPRREARQDRAGKRPKGDRP
jgi:hypothetical protein